MMDVPTNISNVCYLWADILSLTNCEKTMLIIGIAGGSGSGKTTVVNKLVGGMDGRRVTVICQDNYYNDNSGLTLAERRKINFDHPNAIEFPLLINHLKTLRSGRAVDMPTYSFVESTRLAETIRVEPCDVVIVEGILVLAIAELREIMDIKVFVDADADDRLARRIRCDVRDRGRLLENVLNHYETTVKPMHLQFIEPSKRYADLIVPQGGDNEIAIDVLRHFIEKKIG